MVGLGGFEPPTSPLSGVRSNQLSYRPKICSILGQSPHQGSEKPFLSSNRGEHLHEQLEYLFKEVIQPQVPLRLPCYDFTPVMNHKVVSVLRS